MGSRKQSLSRLDLLLSPAFLLAVTILLLNDFFLKNHFGNWFTGKCSDFAGLYALTLFLIALWPKHPWRICSAVLLGFLYWKSPYSEPLLDTLLSFGFSVARVVDYSDLIALPMIAAAVFYSRSTVKRKVGPFLSMTLFCISCFAFCATSCTQPLSPKQKKLHDQLMTVWPREQTSFQLGGLFGSGERHYTLQMGKKKFLDSLKNRGYELSSLDLLLNSNYMFWNKNSQSCLPALNELRATTKSEELNRAESIPVFSHADFRISESKTGSDLHLMRLVLCNFKNEKRINQEEAIRGFEKLISFAF